MQLVNFFDIYRTYAAVMKEGTLLVTEDTELRGLGEFLRKP